jgi:hypothetical protein
MNATEEEFRCELCGKTFPMGDDAEARAEALANGFDPDDDCGLTCDECYEAFMADFRAFPEKYQAP